MIVIQFFKSYYINSLNFFFQLEAKHKSRRNELLEWDCETRHREQRAIVFGLVWYGEGIKRGDAKWLKGINTGMVWTCGGNVCNGWCGILSVTYPSRFGGLVGNGRWLAGCQFYGRGLLACLE